MWSPKSPYHAGQAYFSIVWLSTFNCIAIRDHFSPLLQNRGSLKVAHKNPFSKPFTQILQFMLENSQPNRITFCYFLQSVSHLNPLLPLAMLTGVLQPGAISFISLFKESLIRILFLSNAMLFCRSDSNIYTSHLLWSTKSQWKLCFIWEHLIKMKVKAKHKETQRVRYHSSVLEITFWPVTFTALQLRHRIIHSWQLK